MAKYKIYQNKNEKSPSFEKWYARKTSQGLVTQEELLEHMAGHNSGFSKGMVKGVVTELVEHVRELAYEGKSVKIDNLGIFSVSMRSKGVADPAKFSAATDITSKWQVKPTGGVLVKGLGTTRAGGAALTWEEDNDYTSPRKKAATPSTGA